jgi:hypothetical protein
MTTQAEEYVIQISFVAVSVCMYVCMYVCDMYYVCMYANGEAVTRWLAASAYMYVCMI